MVRVKIIAIAILVAQPGYAATCHHYSKWYYPYPQNCHNNRYTAEFKFMNKLKFKNNVQPISIPEPPPSPVLQWTKAEDFPDITVPQIVVCTDKMSPSQYGYCVLRIELEKRREGAPLK